MEMKPKKNISQVLKSLKNAWEDAEPMTATSIKDGDYVAKISSMEVSLSKNGRPQVVTTFVIADGKYKGKEKLRFDGIDNDTSMSFFKGFAETIGVDLPEDITDLPEALESFVDSFDALVNISMNNKGEYQNVYVKGLSEYTEDEASAEEEEESSSEEETSEEDSNEEETPTEDEEEEKPRKKFRKEEKKSSKKVRR
jgi:hypothetical protein